MAEMYQNKAFCGAIDCMFQNINEESCKFCKVYQFHKWLEAEGHRIVKFTPPFVDENKNKK